jgi:dihydroxy-acid dehydratase
VLLYGGSILRAATTASTSRFSRSFEAVGTHAAGRMTDEELRELEEAASPGVGACGGQFTANTMAMAFEVLG